MIGRVQSIDILVKVLGAYSKISSQSCQLESLLQMTPDGVQTAPYRPRQVQHRLSQSESAEMVAAYAAGASTQTLHEQYLVDRVTILKHVRDAAVPVRLAVKLTERQRQEIVERYLGGESTPQLGQAFGANPSSIWKVLVQAGVPRRRRS